MKSGLLGAAAGLAAMSLAGEAVAQYWIGQVAASAVRAHQEFEAQCHILTPRDYRRHPALARIRPVVARYFSMSAAGDRVELAKLFTRRKKDGWWRAPGVEGDLANLTDPFVPTNGEIDAAVLEIESIVIGHDNESARGIWLIRLPDPANPGKTRDIRYAIDFMSNAAGTKWYLYRVLVFPGDQRPEEPRPFCHFSEIQPMSYEPAGAGRSYGGGSEPPAGDAPEPAAVPH